MLPVTECEGGGMHIERFFHPGSCTWSYVIADSATQCAAVVDPVLDYDAASGRIGTVSADAIIHYLRTEALKPEWILETHAHADHLSAAQHIKRELGGHIAIGEGIRQVQQTFVRLFNLEKQVPTDGSQFDHLFRDGETFRIGTLEARVMATPGHTSDSLSYVIGDAAFVGDTLFMPDCGTARCDFPGGDAGTLYDSIIRILLLPTATRLFLCHDYAPGGREYRNQCTIAEQKSGNTYAYDGVTREDFIKLRAARDQTLNVPALLLPALQVNIRAGCLPEPDSNGTRYLKIPLDTL